MYDYATQEKLSPFIIDIEGNDRAHKFRKGFKEYLGNLTTTKKSKYDFVPLLNNTLLAITQTISICTIISYQYERRAADSMATPPPSKTRMGAVSVPTTASPFGRLAGNGGGGGGGASAQSTDGNDRDDNSLALSVSMSGSNADHSEDDADDR